MSGNCIAIAVVLTAGCFFLSTPVLAKNKHADVDDLLNHVELGSFSVEYQPSERFKEIAKMMAERHRLRNWVKYLNATYNTAKDVKIIFRDCGASNAYYLPDQRQIVLCYDIVNEMREVFREDYESADADRMAGDALTFIFLHELGHALVHIFGLKVTGTPETNADQVATYILLSRPAREGKINVAVNGALYFGLRASRFSEKPTSDEDMADEHPPDKRRYYQILCWVYGDSPIPENKVLFMGKDIGMSERRLNRCPAEYQEMESAWDEKLEPYQIGDD